MSDSKPLFVPLKTQYYEAFVAGTKDTEYRKHGPRWNADTCKVGREVTLTLTGPGPFKFPLQKTCKPGSVSNAGDNRVRTKRIDNMKQATEGFDSSLCSLASSPEEAAEIQAAIDAWIPWWRCPESQEEWDKLVEQRATFAASLIETHKRAVESGMPRWFIEKVARQRYRNIRKYQRTKRRAEIYRRWPTWSTSERILAMVKFDL